MKVNLILLTRCRESLFFENYRAPLAAMCHFGALPNVLRTDLIAGACRRLTRNLLSVSKQHSSPDGNIKTQSLLIPGYSRDPPLEKHISTLLATLSPT